MDYCVKRLVNSGFTEKNAVQICNSYLCNNDGVGLEAFIQSCEQYETRGKTVVIGGV